MIDALRPWLGVVLGAMLAFTGARIVRLPQSYGGVGLIPASDPLTASLFGVITLVVGVLNLAINLPKLFS